MSSLAARYGFAGWEDLHHDPDNAELRGKRPNPNVLLPGDEVIVPERRTTKALSVGVEQRHKFMVKLPKVKLRLFLRNSKDEPYVDKRFVVTVGGTKIERKTTGEGLVEVEVPAAAEHARLEVWFTEDPNDPDPNIDRELALGHLDPVDAISGMQARLHNLGYPCVVSGEADPDTLAAARSFRAKVGLPEVDEPKGADEDGDEEAVEPYEADNPENTSNVEPTEDDSSERESEERWKAYVASLLDDAFQKKLCVLHDGGA